MSHSRRVKIIVTRKAPPNVWARLWRHKLTRRIVLVKGVVSVALLASFHPVYGAGAVLVGSFLWLWVDRDN